MISTYAGADTTGTLSYSAGRREELPFVAKHLRDLRDKRRR